ncbi:MAG: IS110 family transposase [Chloroflexota bacterium]|nr:MAG: IS110 family transposase [Chloroflexota bacterium]
MDPETTRIRDDTTFYPYLYMAIELSNAQWKLGFTVGFGQPPRLRNVTARNLTALADEIHQAKVRFGLAENTPTLSCYEAGRDGFWLHRYLQTRGVTNLVVDSASIEVNRRKRRAKTDRMDVGKLLTMLIRYHMGEKKVWSVVNVPSLEEEDRRQLHRELMAVKAERTHHINRIKGLLASQGVMLPFKKDFLSDLEAVHLWDGSPLPANLYSRLLREYERYKSANQQINQIECERAQAIRTSDDPVVEQVRQLLRLRGIGLNSAWLYVMEFFSWRNFKNRQELSSLAGLTPTPYQSGDSSRERGISKAGNRHIRAMAIEVAWAWLHHQPDSKLSRWYQERFGQGGSRTRRIGIVALARRLLVELWKYLETGAIPDGALLKEA